MMLPMTMAMMNKMTNKMTVMMNMTMGHCFLAVVQGLQLYSAAVRHVLPLSAASGSDVGPLAS